MIKSIAAVVIGYAVFGISAFALFKLSGQAPHAPASRIFMLGATVYGVAFAALAGFTAAWLAPTRPLLHAGVIAGFIAFAASAALVLRPQEGSIWSQLVALVLIAPAVLPGGWVRVLLWRSP